MKRRWSVLAESILLALGCGGAATLAVALVPRIGIEHQVKQIRATSAAAQFATQDAPAGSLIGELRIPELGLRTPVLEDCTAETLQRGSCRMAGTAQLGGLGTTAIAGHRDSSFRALQAAAPGTAVEVHTPAGTYQYRIDQTRIVAPEDVSVLAVGERPGLVLITCYPFHYVGSAPKRFVVQAHLLSVAASE